LLLLGLLSLAVPLTAAPTVEPTVDGASPLSGVSLLVLLLLLAMSAVVVAVLVVDASVLSAVAAAVVVAATAAACACAACAAAASACIMVFARMRVYIVRSTSISCAHACSTKAQGSSASLHSLTSSSTASDCVRESACQRLLLVCARDN
jgi:hypothetical protein